MQINDRNIELSHTQKVLFAENGITKGDLIDYYRRISSVMLPHLEGRPMTLHRFPEGIEGEGFYQQQVPEYFPDWIDLLTVERKQGGTISHVVCNNTATLVYLANLACVTPHVWLSRSTHLKKPDKMLFDLDPPEEDFSSVVKAARALREHLDGMRLPSYLMTTGSKGLHVVVPIVPELSFDEVRAHAVKIAEHIAGNQPQAFTTEQRIEKREGRVFIDYLRNAYGQTSVAPYSIRSLRDAPVATPLDWEELSIDDFDPRRYNIKNIFRRLGQKEDPWKDMVKSAVALDEAF